MPMHQHLVKFHVLDLDVVCSNPHGTRNIDSKLSQLGHLYAFSFDLPQVLYLFSAQARFSLLRLNNQYMPFCERDELALILEECALRSAEASYVAPSMGSV